MFALVINEGDLKKNKEEILCQSVSIDVLLAITARGSIIT